MKRARTAYLKEQEDLRAFRDKESITRDGVRIEVCANIGSVADADSALAQGADGVGLMRSEFLYLDAAELPDEAAQVDAYSQVLRRMNGKRVVVRTLDIGADKVPSYLPLPHEENSALGLPGHPGCALPSRMCSVRNYGLCCALLCTARWPSCSP